MNLMRIFNRISAYKDDNKGSVLVTVLVAFLFISVLVTMLLSTVSVNFRMRAIDRRTKDEFYYAEKALNDIYTGIGQECSTILGRKYNVVLNQYKDGTKHTYVDQNKAYEKFVQGFVDSFSNEYKTSTLESKLNGFIVKDTTLKGASGATSRALADIDLSKCTILYYRDIERKPSDSIDVSELSSTGYKVRSIVIKNVSVVSNPDASENAGYVSKITTDIVIDVPWIDFFNVNKSGYDFAFAANGGLFIKNGATVNVSGNMFAGTMNFTKITSSMNDSSEYGGININGGTLNVENADYVISGGDINLLRTASTPATSISTINIKNNSKFSNQIWFENLEFKNLDAEDATTSDHALYKADIAGNLFASGDLQVDGNYADVNITGSYYGYNNGAEELSMKGNGKILYTKESKYKVNSYNGVASTLLSGDNESLSARSSSVLVNGMHDTVAFKDLKTMMVMGNAYINHEADTAKGITVQDGKITLGEVPENVALKASQMVIYVPAEFLKVTNPVRYATGQADPFEVDGAISSSDWFGKDYINATNDHKIVKIRNENTGTNYAYCYLNFKEDTVPVTIDDGTTVDMSCRDAYVYELIKGSPEGAEPTAATLKKRISDAIAAYDSKVTINETTDSRIYSTSSIVEYGDGGLRYVVDPDRNRIDILQDYSINLYKRYRLMDTYFETLKNEPLSSNSVKDYKVDGKDLTKDGNEMPFARFFWLSGIRNAVGSGQCLSYDIDGDKLILISTSSGNDGDAIDLANVTDQNGNKAFSGKKNAIVLIDGPTYISSGQTVSINGFLASIGKITVEDGATLNVSYDSGVVNRRISNELSLLRKVGGYHDATDDDYEFTEDDIINISKVFLGVNDTTVVKYDDAKNVLGVSAGEDPHGDPSGNLISKQLLSYYMLRTDSSTFDATAKASNNYKLKMRGDDLKIPSKINLTVAEIENTNSKPTDAEKLDRTISNSGIITFYRMYQYDGKTAEEVTSSVNTDYTNYIYFDRWKKGQE